MLTEPVMLDRRHIKSLDAEAARLLRAAKSIVKTQGTAIDEALRWVARYYEDAAEDNLRVLRSLSEDQEKRKRKKEEGQAMMLRIDMEKVLMRLDTCYSPAKMSSAEKLEFAETDNLERLDGLVKDACRLIRKRNHVSLWKRYKAVDRIWPRLKLCSRAEGLLARVVRQIPERPLEVFSRLKRLENEEGDLARKFFALMVEIRGNERDPAKVDWQPFESLFLRFREERKGVGRRATGPGAENEEGRHRPSQSCHICCFS